MYFWYGNAATRTFGRARRRRPYGFVWVGCTWNVWNKTIYVSHYNYIFSYPTIDAVVAIKGLPDIFEEDYDATLFKRGKLYYRLLNKETYYENEFIPNRSLGFKALCKKVYDKVEASEKLKEEDDE